MSKLFELVHEAVLLDWDPIGIAGIPEASNEYDAYIPEIDT